MSPRETIGMLIWLYKDGKPGHERQSHGLINALAERRALQVEMFEPSSTLPVRWAGLFRSGRRVGATPDLIIGAGHRTHLPMLAARRTTGARVVVLMKPSLPISFFDLCVVPRHDRVAPNEKVFQTYGVLNDLRPSPTPSSDDAMILLGGPSRHYRWSQEQLQSQIKTIVSRYPDYRWTVADSRRTPPTTLPGIAALGIENVSTVDHRQTAPGWLAKCLSTSALVWVSEDSVSMIYEALTCGVATGLLSMPSRHSNRLRDGIKELCGKGLVTSYEDWERGREPDRPKQPFNEAERLAHWMLTEWL